MIYTQKTTASLASRIDEATREAQAQIDSGLIQGVVFALGDAGPVTAVGWQRVKPEKRPMTPASRFDMASAGKTFTASCCAILASQGRLDPDAPLTRYLPEHALGPSCAITVRDLATHASGFDNSKPYNSADADVFLRELMHKLPVRSRQEAFEYACSNFILLGLIVERISGQGLEEFAAQQLWSPLGMTNTQWTAPGDGPDEVEHWHPNRTPGLHNDDVCFICPFPIGSGSCFSTVPDMLKFLQDILARKQFAQSYYDLIGGCGFAKNGARRSFGWDMSAAHRPRHCSDNAIYHSGFTGQSICVDPDTGFAAAVLTSRMGDWEQAYQGRVRIMEKLAGFIG